MPRLLRSPLRPRAAPSSRRPQPPLHACRAVLLDIDDTLLDTTNAMITAGAGAMEAVWPGREHSWYANASVRFRYDPGGFFKRYTTGEIGFEQMRRLRLEEVAEHEGVELPADAVGTYEYAFRPAFEAAQCVFADVLPFLDRCAEAGLAVGALTNSSAAATDSKLAATGSTGWFTALVTRDSLGFGKPDPRVFQHACAELGVGPEETAYVGDELEADVLGAAAAGLRPVWLRREGVAAGQRPHAWQEPVGLPDGTIVVRDLTQLPDRLGDRP